MEKQDIDANCENDYGRTSLIWHQDLAVWKLPSRCFREQKFSETWYFGRSALHLASLQECADLIKLLAKRGEVEIDATDAVGQFTSLHLATLMGDAAVVKVLLEDHRLDVSMKCGENGQTALHLASSIGDLEIIQALLSNKYSDINDLDNYGYSAKH